MRPLHLEVEGFSAYRKRVEADFADVDFFSLSGPTGSGKSSLIDAMVFALYGRVPRLGGKAVAPAIAAGADLARVRLRFEVEGSVYTATRLAQRTPTGGATVKEARLEAGDRNLASGADEVTGAVEDLLNLRFDDFTRTVVLPQGEFARFLTATKAERQGLLRNLLGLDLYTTMRELAKTRAAVANERAEGAARSHDTLDLADDDELVRARERVETLSALVDTVSARERDLVSRARDIESLQSAVERLTEAMGRLDAVEPPDQLGELDSLVAEARSSVADAEQRHSAAIEQVQQLEKALSDLPSPERIRIWQETMQRKTALAEKLALCDVESVARTIDDAERRLAGLTADLGDTRSALAEARVGHAAHTLTATLEAGHPCPVCEQLVTEVPERVEPAELVVQERREQDLVAAVDQSREAVATARTELARLETSRAGLLEQLETVATGLADAPAPEELVALDEEVSRLAAEIGTQRAVVAEQQDQLRREMSILEDLADSARRVAKQLTSTQISVAGLGPPVSESDDVVVQWKELLEWRDQTIGAVSAELAETTARVESMRDEVSAQRDALLQMLEAAGVAGEEPYQVGVAGALHEARARVERHEAARTESERLAKVIDESRHEAAVADSLAGHLRANGFEQWLMASAVGELVTGANELLGQLSSGGYSLDSDDAGTFSIIDHHNADEARSVATLSGGETFLVSLALALSLAETLAAKGGAGLDAIILDEGFGTLDDDSLDTVATVLEELTGRGLMVGVITHVKELAARAPVRFEVGREPTGATVRRVA